MKIINLSHLDELLYWLLTRFHARMPSRFVKLIAYYYTDARVRKLYLRKMGIVMGQNTFSNLGLKIAIDEFSDNRKVEIGNNVSIGPNLILVVDSCANNGVEINKIKGVKEKYTKKGFIKIEDEVWLGASVTILPNVTIGKCSVIGAGSLVTKDVPSYSVYAGTPAKLIKKLK
ncbi:acyltransferase [Psychroflexus salinarum]|uniref:Acyltransferase n=1 Tax=Psychroflexus salinarum TaxID=546024 RepID=A0ABW3GY66_9FLAO